MRLVFSLSLVACIAFHSTAADAQDTSRLVSGDPLRGPDVPFREIKYGPRSYEVMRFNLPKQGKGAPLVVFIGNDGWRGGVDPYPMHLLRSALFEDGYAFAAIDYTPRYTNDPGSAQAMLDNIITGLRTLIADAERLGFDPTRIVLIGNGAGGHFVTLLGTDPTLLGDRRMFAALKGVVSVNGHGFDIPQQIAKASPFRAKAFKKAFGTDAATHVRLSPVRHLGAPNAPAFLFQAVTDHPHIQNQAMSMYKALSRAGARAAYAPLPPWRDTSSRSYYGLDSGVGYIHLAEFLRAVLPSS